jgi:hypothetical protein
MKQQAKNKVPTPAWKPQAVRPLGLGGPPPPPPAGHPSIAGMGQPVPPTEPPTAEPKPSRK